MATNNVPLYTSPFQYNLAASPTKKWSLFISWIEAGLITSIDQENVLWELQNLASRRQSFSLHPLGTLSHYCWIRKQLQSTREWEAMWKRTEALLSCHVSTPPARINPQNNEKSKSLILLSHKIWGGLIYRNGKVNCAVTTGILKADIICLDF